MVEPGLLLRRGGHIWEQFYQQKTFLSATLMYKVH